MSIFKACDVRGLVGEELTENVMRRIGLALGEMARAHGGQPVCLGGDFRRSTPPLKQAALAGLVEAGATVFDVGQNPTPLVYFAAAHHGVPNVVIVTASHNPGSYNGLKFMVAGRPTTPPLMDELQSRMRSPGLPVSPGRVEPFEMRAIYERHVRQTAAATAGQSEDRLASRRLKVVLDAMGGAFAEIAPRVLAAAGCQVVPLACELEPDFARRAPDPAVADHLRDLSQRVTAERADLGIALDGDGDRAAFVDSAGVVVKPEQVGALFVRHCFPRPKLVYDLKCASVLAAETTAAGGTCVMQPSGHGFIKTAMIEQQADLGVEVSGHFFFKALGGGDDGLFTGLLVAHILAGSGEALADLIQPIPWPVITPDLRIPLPEGAGDVLGRIEARCGGQVTRLDGVRAQYAEGWALARRSITEPVITLRFEGRDRQSLRHIAARFLAGAPELHKLVQENLP